MVRFIIGTPPSATVVASLPDVTLPKRLAEVGVVVPGTTFFRSTVVHVAPVV